MNNAMNKMQVLLVLAMGFVVMFASAGCTATPVGMAVNLAGDAVNDEDVSSKSNELMGVSVAQADNILGQPVNVFRSDRPTREWRVYPVKNDIAGMFRYVLEFSGGQVIAVNKAQKHSDVVLDTATYEYFKEKCMGNSPDACQNNVGQPPALSARNVNTGQLVQLYDARLVTSVQKPYYAVLRFGPDGMCSDITIVKIAASTSDNLTGQ